MWLGQTSVDVLVLDSASDYRKRLTSVRETRFDYDTGMLGSWQEACCNHTVILNDRRSCVERSSNRCKVLYTIQQWGKGAFEHSLRRLTSADGGA